MKKKNKAQKLTKEQLKKLKGGLNLCHDTNCIEKTCHLFASKDWCKAGDTGHTVSISEPSGGDTPIKGSK